MIQITKSQKEYELLDSGEGEKLERYGQYILRRPDPQSLWKKNLPEKEWANADASFLREGRDPEGKQEASYGAGGRWKFKNSIPKNWRIEFGGLKLKIAPTAFKHTGLFPEQLANWQWAEKIITNSQVSIPNPNILNLFGYTGGATLSAAKAGASVCHVDASKSAITWGRENAELSALSDKPIRWIPDDAFAFVKKEIRRGKKYDGIIMDPPSFGHGPDGEMWKIEDDFVAFVEDCKKLLSETPLFFLISGYAAGYSSTAYRQNISDLVSKFGGTIEDGELAIEESKSSRLLPCGIFARWNA